MSNLTGISGSFMGGEFVELKLSFKNGAYYIEYVDSDGTKIIKTYFTYRDYENAVSEHLSLLT